MQTNRSVGCVKPQRRFERHVYPREHNFVTSPEPDPLMNFYRKLRLIFKYFDWILNNIFQPIWLLEKECNFTQEFFITGPGPDLLSGANFQIGQPENTVPSGRLSIHFAKSGHIGYNLSVRLRSRSFKSQSNVLLWPRYRIIQFWLKSD